MTLAQGIDIQEVIGGESDSEGSYRKVFFVNDDLVIKVNYDDEGDPFGEDSNADEFANYNRLKHFDNTIAIWGGVKFNIRIPAMEKVGDVIIAERVNFPHLDGCDAPFFDDCPCRECQIKEAVDRWCSKHMGLYDIHNYNFCWDADTNTAWIIDLGC